MTATLREQATTSAEVMYMALERSASKWRVAFATPTGERTPQWSIAAGDLAALVRTIERAGTKLGAGAAATLLRCLRGRARRLLAAPLARGSGDQQPVHRRRQHRGQHRAQAAQD